MKELVREELNYLKSKRNFILALLITLEILGLLLEEVSGLFVAAYFIFPALMLEKEVKQYGKEILIRKVFFKMLIMYFVIIPIYIYSHVILYRKIGVNVSDVFITNSITLIISTIFYSMKVMFLKKYGVQKAGAKSLKVVTIIVMSVFVLLLINMLYCVLILGIDFKLVSHLKSVYNKNGIIYFVSLAIISLSYILANRDYGDI